MSQSIPMYAACAMQVDCHALNQCTDRKEASAKILERIDQLGFHVGFVAKNQMTTSGTRGRLFVLPEYVLTGFPMGHSIKEWRHLMAIDMDGAEYEALGRVAQETDTYLAGNAYESDPNFPDLYFQTCFIVGPSGDVILRYRRMISMFAPSPYDVWDKYLDIYGEDAIFPVADTEIGKLGCVASEEIMYPEIARCMAMRGMEVLCHPSSEAGSPLPTTKEICRRARAVENICYVVSANTASIQGTGVLSASTTGISKVIDSTGKILAEAGAGETSVATAILDIDALRKIRTRTGMANLLSRQPFGAYANQYGGHTFVEPNGMLKDGELDIPERSFFLERQQSVIDRLKTDGVLS